MPLWRDSSSSGTIAGLVSRYAGPGQENMYFGGVVYGQLTLYKNIGGTWTQLASTSPGGATSGNLQFSIVGNLLSLSLNGKIVLQIEVDTQPLTAAIGRLEREIEFLREYGTRLVTEVVTGALDVRDAAARLPVEATADLAPEPSDEMDEADLLNEETAT